MFRSIIGFTFIHLDALWQAYRAALQTQWQWVGQLCVCVEQHLKDNTAYFQVVSTKKKKKNLKCMHFSERKGVTIVMPFLVHERCTGVRDVPATASGHHKAAVHMWPKQQTRQTGGPAAGLHGKAGVFSDYTYRDRLPWITLSRWYREKGRHTEQARAV